MQIFVVKTNQRLSTGDAFDVGGEILCGDLHDLEIVSRYNDIRHTRAFREFEITSAIRVTHPAVALHRACLSSQCNQKCDTNDGSIQWAILGKHETDYNAPHMKRNIVLLSLLLGCLALTFSPAATSQTSKGTGPSFKG